MSKEQPYAVAADGTPFKSQQAASLVIHSKGLPPDKFVVVKYQGGWAILDLDGFAASKATEAQPGSTVSPSSGAAPAERYFEVKFMHRQMGTNEPPYVPLTLDGRELRIQRMTPVVLSESFLQIADHAVMKTWVPSKEPNKPMEEGEPVQRYPYEKIREATKEEFNKCLAAGNAIQQSVLERLRRAGPKA